MTASVYGNVTIDKSGPVWTVIIDRPERRNAVDGATAAELANAFRSFDADDSARGRGALGSGRDVLRRG